MSPINKKNDTALTLRSVTKSYDGQPVLSDLSLEFSSGTFYCLMAPSGNGKTTMFRLILGLEKPDSGVILFGTSAGDTGNNDIKASSGTVSKSDPCRIRGMRPLIAAGKFTDRLIQGVFRKKTEQVCGQSFAGISLSKSEAEVFNGGIAFQKTVFLKNGGDQGTHPTDPARIRF